MASLTKKQRQVLAFIERFLGANGHVPSYGEIAAGLGLRSQSTVCVHVQNLVDKGYLTKKWNSNRSLDLTDDLPIVPGARDVPKVGRITAGRPIEAIENHESIPLPETLLGGKETFVLEVSGDSMIEDHVLDGDYVIVEKRHQAQNGDMVVALLEGGEATLKRYRRDGRKIRLEPANPAYEVIVCDEDQVTVQGVVLGILRKFGRR